ncbi:hypothetical protein D3C73_1413720 [compost metagenome]
MAPIITPLTKYFCRNGYSSRIGTVATMIVAYLIVSPIGILSAPPTPVIIESVLFVIRISRKISCSGYRSRVRK